MSDVKVYTFNIGQGLFNLLTEETAHKKFCAVFDCGTLNTSYPLIEENLNSAVQIINEFGGLDLIVISHQDRDHWNKMLNLLEKCYKINIDNNWIFNETNHRYLRKVSSTYELLKEDYYNIFDIYKYIEKDTYILDKHHCINENELELEVNINTDNNKINYDIFIIDNEIYKIGLNINVNNCEYNKKIKYDEIEDNINNLSIDEYTKRLILDNIYIDIDELKKYKDFQKPKFKYKINECIPKIIICGYERSASYNNFCNAMNFFGNVEFFYISYVVYFNYKYMHSCCSLDFDIIGLNRSIIRNATSTISVYKYDDDKSIIFPGDATYHVFNDLYKKINISAPVELLIAPHHGSFDTNIVLDKENKLLPDDNQPFLKLLDKIKPKTVFISALLSKFGHPDLKFLEYVSNFAQNVQKHNIKYSSKLENIKEGIFQSQKAVFSTESMYKDFRDNFLLFPDILQIGQNKVSKPKENNFILPPDDLFI